MRSGGSFRRLLLATLAAALTTLVTGCPAPARVAGHDNLSVIARYYGLYQGSNKGQTPPNEKKLKEFMQQKDASLKVDELFVSPRDSEPYVVRYAIQFGVPD